MNTTQTSTGDSAAGAVPVRSEQPEGVRVPLGQNIEIFSGRSRPDMASFGTEAFEARDRRAVGEQLALLCDRAYAPRISMLPTYKNLRNPHVLKLLDAAVVDWPLDGRKRFALVFDMPPARRLMTSLESKPHRMTEESIVRTLVQPLLSVLADLRNVDLIHGAINPMNIFFSGTDGAELVLLGECLTSAPSLRQHALFEPIERAMAQGSGRGMGTLKDDLYALGVCAALAVRGENLLAGKTEHQVIRQKMDEGSYAALVGRERLPGGISEFLRGVLSDDDHQRWSLDEAMSWVEGRRLSPKQSRTYLRAARPFTFKEEKYWDLRSISYAFSKNVDEGAAVAEHDQFDLWIKRNFEEKHLMKRLEGVWDREKSSSRERLMCGICMALDPYAPIHYKGLSIFPGGFGTALAEAIATGKDLQPYGDIISLQFFSNWVNQRFEEIPDAPNIVTQFEKCRNYLAQKLAGYGLERVLYVLNKDSVCMSPHFAGDFVTSAASLLQALDRLSRRQDRPDMVFDRHMIAYLSVTDPKMIDPFLGHITSLDKANKVIGVLRSLTAIQKRSNASDVVGLTTWVASLLGPAVERYYDLDLRQLLAKKVSKAQDSGKLQDLLDIVDDSSVVREDQDNYAQAQRRYAHLELEKQVINNYLQKRRNFGRATGRQVAMLVSSIMAGIFIVIYLIYYFAAGVR